MSPRPLHTQGRVRARRALENRQACKRLQGSNPCPSVTLSYVVRGPRGVPEEVDEEADDREDQDHHDPEDLAAAADVVPRMTLNATRNHTKIQAATAAIASSTPVA